MVASLVIAPFFQDLPQARIVINLFFTSVLLFSIVPLLNTSHGGR